MALTQVIFARALLLVTPFPSDRDRVDSATKLSLETHSPALPKAQPERF